MDNLVSKLYKTPKSIFTTKDLSLVWQEKNKKKLYSKISYYLKKGEIKKLSRGIFAKDKNYDIRELATSIYSPSYISFETVLVDAGIIFQYYETIFIATKWTRRITIDDKTFCLRKIKDLVLYNPEGIISKNNYNIASPERAFLDMIYLFPNYYFDNLRPIDWDKCSDLIKIYDNQKLVERFLEYKKNVK